MEGEGDVWRVKVARGAMLQTMGCSETKSGQILAVAWTEFVKRRGHRINHDYTYLRCSYTIAYCFWHSGSVCSPGLGATPSLDAYFRGIDPAQVLL